MLRRVSPLSAARSSQSPLHKEQVCRPAALTSLPVPKNTLYTRCATFDLLIDNQTIKL
jgi:hypothetical protein